MYTTIRQVRHAFWLSRAPRWSGFQGWQAKDSDYSPDIQADFRAFVGGLRQNCEIPELLARNITL